MPDTAEIDYIDNGDGTFTDPASGVIVDWDYNIIGVDPGAAISWIDNGDGTYTNPANGVVVDEGYNFVSIDSDFSLVPRDGSGTEEGGGFFSSVGNFLSNLFGGGTLSVSATPGGANPGAPGGGSQVLQPGGAVSPAQRDRQMNTILIAGAVGLGVYALTRRRND